VNELESLAHVLAYIDRTGGLAGAYVQGVDLTADFARLVAVDVTNAVFLGCGLSPKAEEQLIARGALVFPRLPNLPFDPYRPSLYTADELYAGLPDGYQRTLDARVYRWWKHIGRHRDLESELAMTLHDHAVSDALGEIAPTNAVGVMGGHQMARDSHAYADAGTLGHRLVADGFAVLTGGGPGAMEAVNLGAALDGTPRDLTEAIWLLARAPRFADDITAWARAAFDVRERFALPGASFGVPTWFYGHEPPNAFPRAIAKYFSNAIREDILLRLSAHGLVCLPGAAGTVQEIFQALTPRYYATQGPVPPLVLVGTDYWTTRLPAWPLVEALAQGRAMAGYVHLTESMAEVPDLLARLNGGHPPVSPARRRERKPADGRKLRCVSETPPPEPKRRHARLWITLAAIVAVIAAGITLVWRLGGFDGVSIQPLPGKPGEVYTINGIELTFNTAYVRHNTDNSAVVHITGTCRNTNPEGTDFLGWLGTAVMVVDPASKGPEGIGKHVSARVDVGFWDSAAFNPTTEPLPCDFAADFPQGYQATDRVNVAVGPVNPVPNQFDALGMGAWEPARYRWPLIHVPLVPPPS